VARNVAVQEGELDLLASDSGTGVAVEVRTITGAADPIDAIGPAKRKRVRTLAARIGAHRVDFVGIQVHASGVDVHWVSD
jgi:Holliday junction resolvase-like predicted endonuclease